jgi:hypothetical protein
MAGFEQRHYRLDCRRSGMVSFTSRVKETDLWILAPRDLSAQAEASILRHRRGLEVYLAQNPAAALSLEPLPEDPLAPALARTMIRAGRAAGTGPMAAVAGALAQVVAEDLLDECAEVAVENGGDLYLSLKDDLTVGISAGKSPLSGKVGLKFRADNMPLAVGTSSGTVGHSLSMGKSDAATVVATGGALADAAATALGNRVTRVEDLAPALEWVGQVPGVSGALVVLGKHLAAWGEITLVDLKKQEKA